MFHPRLDQRLHRGVELCHFPVIDLHGQGIKRRFQEIVSVAAGDELSRDLVDDGGGNCADFRFYGFFVDVKDVGVE